MKDENTSGQTVEEPRRDDASEKCRCPYCKAECDELTECSECDHRMCSDCPYQCSGCSSVLCEDCVRYCERCDGTLCGECSRWCAGCDSRYCNGCLEYCEQCDDDYCPGCIEQAHEHDDTKEPCYRDPYPSNPKARNVFTFGLEIEIDADHDHEMMQSHPLIAGWCPDGSLGRPGALEYQTQPMTMRDLDALVRLVSRLHPYDDDNSHAGGHMHISRASGQTAARWYWALHALDQTQAETLNMRHLGDSRWCRLEHGEYSGKSTAVNNDHADTIELRTFGPWYALTADRLTPAVVWTHTMWRLFQHHPLYQLKRSDIMAASRTAYRHAITSLKVKEVA